MNAHNIRVITHETPEASTTFEFNKHRVFLEVYADAGGDGMTISVDDTEVFRLEASESYQPYRVFMNDLGITGQGVILIS